MPKNSSFVVSIRAGARALLAAPALLAWPGGPVHAQNFPTQVVRIVVPTAAGGGLDIVARQLAQKLTDAWGQGVIVDNRAGAGGTIGADVVAKAPPDGHTIALVSSTFPINASLYSKLPYDSLRDFAPVTLVVNSPLILVVNPALPVHSVKELVALAKARPGQINYASTGNGGVIHLATELMKSLAGINLTHIPYKGTVPAVTDVMGGQVELTITGVPVAMPHVATGKLRALAVTGSRRSAAAPNVPTIGETIRGYEFNNWFGILAPAATPKETLVRLHDGIVRALQAPDVRQRMLAQGDEPAGTSSAQFADMIRQEITKYAKLVKDIGVHID
jgi:tripartite-type tricarboxylate transporter receptor subunit TctC